MPAVRPDSLFQEFLFTPEESIQARILTPLQIQWLSTEYCRLLKEKANSMIPETSMDDRVFLLAVAAVDGKMAFITELFQNHKEATQELVKVTQDASNPLESLESRAANQVHIQN